MSLIKCRECNKEVSDTAKSCPHCGAKIKTKHGHSGCLLWGIGLFIFISFISDLIGERKGSLTTRTRIGSQDIYVSSGVANVRKEPNGEVVGKVKLKDHFTYINKKDDWLQITYNDKPAWISKKVVVTEQGMQAERHLRANTCLVVEKWSWFIEHSYVSAKGQVTNHCNLPINSLQAVVTFKDKDGNYITHASALVEYSPLMPNQTTPFEVLEHQNPLMKKASLGFKEMLGSEMNSVKKEDFQGNWLINIDSYRP
ncbi:MAG: SH3 domain-containing protein [Alphaproteobacteria bacterium]